MHRLSANAGLGYDLLAERKRSEELEDRYSLMLRELQAQAEGDFIIVPPILGGDAG